MSLYLELSTFICNGCGNKVPTVRINTCDAENDDDTRIWLCAVCLKKALMLLEGGA